MNKTSDLRALMKKAAKLFDALPAADRKRSQDWQAIDFSYGNLALSTNHRPVRWAFRDLALGKGIPLDEFDRWANDRQWRPE